MSVIQRNRNPLNVLLIKGRFHAVPFGVITAQRIMNVAQNRQLSKVAQRHIAWATECVNGNRLNDRMQVPLTDHCHDSGNWDRLPIGPSSLTISITWSGVGDRLTPPFESG